MQKNFMTACALWAIAVLLFLNLASAFFKPSDAGAQHEGAIGRYEISAWALPSRGAIHLAGYYVVDTATGKVVARETERLTTDR